MPGHANRIAQSRRIHAVAAGGRVDFQHRGAIDLGVHAIFGDVAVGADAHVELRSVLAGDQALGPVMVELVALARQVGDLDRRAGAGVAFAIRHAHQRVGVGDIQRIADQGHAEWRGQVFQECGLEFGHAIAVGVAQQTDAVGTGHAATGLLHHRAHDLALDPAGAALARRCVGLGHQHVAIGQHVQPAWMVQAAGEGVDREACGRGGFLALLPADRRGDVHGRQRDALRLGQGRIGAGVFAGGQARALTATTAAGHAGQQQRGQGGMPKCGRQHAAVVHGRSFRARHWHAASG